MWPDEVADEVRNDRTAEDDKGYLEECVQAAFFDEPMFIGQKVSAREKRQKLRDLHNEENYRGHRARWPEHQ